MQELVDEFIRLRAEELFNKNKEGKATIRELSSFMKVLNHHTTIDEKIFQMLQDKDLRIKILPRIIKVIDEELDKKRKR